jgi:hypothetical protein
VPDETEQSIDKILKEHINKLGTISVLFYAIENMRRKVMGDVVPTLQTHDVLPEKAFKGSSITHSAQ